jgi:hypothetical protein
VLIIIDITVSYYPEYLWHFEFGLTFKSFLAFPKALAGACLPLVWFHLLFSHKKPKTEKKEVKCFLKHVQFEY